MRDEDEAHDVVQDAFEKMWRMSKRWMEQKQKVTCLQLLIIR
ncbi:MAG: hypothetical protein IPJ66_16105 [Bacteroidetes bacterium]|nr:hypothetical protein [Bacteroidota bacterium]